jgi:hypothetical protein
MVKLDDLMVMFIVMEKSFEIKASDALKSGNLDYYNFYSGAMITFKMLKSEMKAFKMHERLIEEISKSSYEELLKTSNEEAFETFVKSEENKDKK